MLKYSFRGCLKCLYEEFECSYCHKKIIRLKSELNKNKTGKLYCSRECGNRDKNENITNKTDGSAYRRNALATYPNECCACGYKEDIRILEVHHLDENRNNNHIDNLRILCPNCHKKLTLHLYTFEELLEYQKT